MGKTSTFRLPTFPHRFVGVSCESLTDHELIEKFLYAYLLFYFIDIDVWVFVVVVFSFSDCSTFFVVDIVLHLY